MLVNISNLKAEFPISPAELGMPAKFNGWRSTQAQALSLITETFDDSAVECVGLNMPTGSGKSGVYVGAALMYGRRAVTLTHTKALQQQLMDDFEVAGMVDIRGRSNYACNHFVATNCEDGAMLGCKQGKTGRCPYRAAFNSAQTTQLCNTNYALWLALRRYTDEPLTLPEILVLDEAHDAGDYLCQMLSFEISGHDVNRRLAVAAPGNRRKISAWQDWATGLLPTALLLLGDQRKQVLAAPSNTNIKELGKFGRLIKNLETLATLKGHWVVQEDEYTTEFGNQRTWKFDLVHPAPYRELLLPGDVFHLLVSATLTPYTLERLGYDASKTRIAEFPSPFDRLRSPFYAWPIARLTHKSTEEEKAKWVEGMDTIIASRADRKGIIHCSSYDRAVYIRYKSKYADRMILHDPGSSATVAAIARHIASPSPTILVSPALTTGYDFAYGAAEFQIIAKVPFPDTRSAVMAQRCGAGFERTPEQEAHGAYLVANAIVQMDGRGTRAMDDRCETFMVDGNFGWFYTRNKSHFPAYFRNRVKWIDRLPRLPPKL